MVLLVFEFIILQTNADGQLEGKEFVERASTLRAVDASPSFDPFSLMTNSA